MLLLLLAQAQDQFVPFTPGAGQETLPAGPLIYTAYALVWIIMLAYVFLLWQRIGKVERELKDVAAKLKTPR